MNPVNRNTSGTETYSLNKGNLWFGVGGREYGPTSVTNFYLGISPPKGGYVIYAGKASDGQSNYVANNDTELVTILSSITSNTFADVEEALVWVAGQDDFAVISKSEPEIVTGNLVLNVDASSKLSYPTSESVLYDTSGNNNTGSLENTIVFQTGGWLEFDGTDDYVNFGPSNAILPTGDFTMEAWYKYEGSGGSNIQCILGNFDSANAMIAMDKNNGDFELRARIAGGNQAASGGTNANDGNWHHIVGTIERGSPSVTLNVYGDGDLQGTTSTGDNPVDLSSDVLALGRSINGTARDFAGDISVARIYDKVLSPTEIKQNYFGGPIVTNGLIFAVDSRNLVSYESGSSTVYQLTGSESNGTLSGAGYDDKTSIFTFDGTDDYIDFGVSNAILPTGDFTMEAWYKYEGSSLGSNIQCILGNFNSANAMIAMDKVNGDFEFRVTLNGTSQLASGGTTANDGKWHHIVGTIEKGANSTLKIYGDGSLLNESSTSNTTLTTSTDVLALGRSINGTAREFAGDIAVARIYDRALSAEEVRQNYLAQWGRYT